MAKLQSGRGRFQHTNEIRLEDPLDQMPWWNASSKVQPAMQSVERNCQLPKCLDFVYATTAFKLVTTVWKNKCPKTAPRRIHTSQFWLPYRCSGSRRMESISHQPSSGRVSSLIPRNRDHHLSLKISNQNGIIPPPIPHLLGIFWRLLLPVMKRSFMAEFDLWVND